MKQETIFYSRTETENEIIIKWKPYTTYGSYLYLILAVFSQMFSNFSPIFIFLAIASLIMMIVNSVVTIVATKKVTFEARMAQEKGNCKLQGNRYSFSNPLVLYIYK